MIRWCAYCQRYLGEVAPFDDYAMTHTICPECQASGAFLRKPSANLDAIRDFFARIALAGFDRPLSARELVAEGAALGLAPLDLMLGILQPMLYELGDRWTRSEVSIAEEHRISALCSEVIQSILEADDAAEALGRARPTHVLLVSADGNDHVLGIRILEVVLLRRQIPTVAVYPGLPVAEIVELARGLRPRVVGISAVTPEHVRVAQELADQLAGAGGAYHPLVVVGGLALRGGIPGVVRPPLVACRDLGDFVGLVSAAPAP